jgi:hypothetical protein
LKSNEKIVLELVNITGRTVNSTDMGTLNTGKYNEKIRVNDLPSGVYLLNIRTGESVTGKKVFVQ